MTRDLEAALREAKLLGRYETGKAKTIIDIALAAASGEASGGDEGLPTADDVKGILGPAPSEAPNVERAQPINRRHEENARALVNYAIAEYVATTNDDREESWARIMRALDSARAEGIAAERQRCTKIADDAAANCDWMDGKIEARAIAVAIREAKP